MLQENKSEVNTNLLHYYEEQQQMTASDKVVKAQKIIRQTEQVNVDDAFLQVKTKINNTHFIGRVYKQFSRYAAILFIPMLLIASWGIWENLLVPSHGQLAQSLQEVDCPIGVRSKVVLPDGTIIWMNSGSIIKYNLPFTNDKRLVELQGEAFLDVAKLKNSQFILSSGNVKVKVLGTRFDFRSYPNDERVEVSLLEGKIDLSIEDRNHEVKKATLKPGDHLSYNRKDDSTLLQNKNLDKYVAWKHNRMVFEDTPLIEVARELERWYGVDAEITDKELLAYKFTTTFENAPLLQVIELLELSSPIKIKYIPKELTNGKDTNLKSQLIFFKR